MIRNLLFILLLNLFPFLLKAQETSPSPQGQKDFQLWLDAGLKYKVNKKFDLSFEAAYRRDNNLADVSQTYLELQAKSDPLKFLVVSGGYRLSGWFDKYLVNRLFAYARFSFDIERLKVQYRLRYDNNFNTSFEQLPDFIRNKIKLKYRIRKFPIDPYFAYELFYRTNYIDPEFTQQRFDIGLDYSISKKNSLQVYYRFQQELNAYAPEKNFILGISYSFDL